MRHVLIAITLGLSVAPACGGPQLVAGVELGSKLRSDDARFQAADGGTFALRAPVPFEGRQPARVVALVDAKGVVHEVDVHFDADAANVEALAAWSSQLCKKIGGQAEERTPSPLGTPEPGENWDPVITTYKNCAGKYAGRPARVHYEHSRASDFDRASATVEISATEAPAGD